MVSSIYILTDTQSKLNSLKIIDYNDKKKNKKKKIKKVNHSSLTLNSIEDYSLYQIMIFLVLIWNDWKNCSMKKNGFRATIYLTIWNL